MMMILVDRYMYRDDVEGVKAKLDAAFAVVGLTAADVASPVRVHRDRIVFDQLVRALDGRFALSPDGNEIIRVRHEVPL